MANFLFLYYVTKGKSCIDHITTQTVTFQVVTQAPKYLYLRLCLYLVSISVFTSASPDYVPSFKQGAG